MGVSSLVPRPHPLTRRGTRLGSEFEEVLGELQDLLSALQEVKSRWEDIESGTATPATLQPKVQGVVALSCSSKRNKLHFFVT